MPLRTTLDVEGIRLEGVLHTSDCCSGVAMIGVEDSGQNCITVVQGANGRLTPDDVQTQAKEFARADVLLLQLEIPIETVLTAIKLARTNDVLTILDPAPAMLNCQPEMLHVDVVCPNETEATLLTGIDITTTESSTLGRRKASANGSPAGDDHSGRQGRGFPRRVRQQRACGAVFGNSDRHDGSRRRIRSSNWPASFRGSIASGGSSFRLCCRRHCCIPKRSSTGYAVPRRREWADDWTLRITERLRSRQSGILPSGTMRNSIPSTFA